jgi:eukaryotic-like serine/threonine-protein kinase
MALASGSRLGSYQIVDAIGAGGMGEVYRATDSHLKRSVAIKVLPASVAGDADRLARFQREAEVLAALNHPNIAAVYGLEKTPDLTALVMELVDGEDLSALIARGPIAAADALPIARQITEALEAAHEQGIIHRDLKPANIKVRADGTVKVLDFGLAKAMDPAGASSANAMHSPTLTARATEMGMILGTAAYMAPEQARGRAVDRRADIWAFGVVLYEMLSGRRAFDGDDISITLASVLKEDVDWRALPPDLPAPIGRLLRRCLEKDPRKRLSAIGDARLEIDEATRSPQQPDSPATSSSLAIADARRRERLAWIVAAVGTLVGVVALAALWWPRERPVAPQRIQFAVQTQADPGSVLSLDVPAISPDGRLLAFVSPATAGGAKVIWIRPIDALDARTLAGTEGGSKLFWSPDSRSIGYAADDRIYRVGADGGAPQMLCEMPNFSSAAWTRSGSILMTTVGATMGGRLFTVSEQGGPPVEVTLAGAEGVAKYASWPFLLPDGRHFLYLGWAFNPDVRALYVGSLDGGAPVRLMQMESMAVYVDPGFLLFVRAGILFAQRFDARALELAGEPVRLADDVMTNRVMGRAAFSASDTGTLVYRTSGGTTSLSELAWVDRTGKVTATVGDARTYYQMRLSPDGRRVATSEGVPGSSNTLSVLDLGNGVASAVTDSQTLVNDQAWSPDGQTVAYEALADKRLQFFKQVLGSQKPTRLFESPVTSKYLDDWSSDGKFLLFHLTKPGQLFVVPVDGSTEPRLLLDSIGIDEAHFSPDGKWIAYQITESNTYQVWVASFPAFEERRRVSPAGGGQPVWGRDGKELFYLTPTGKLMLVSVDRKAAGAIDFTAPVELFQSPLTAPALVLDQYAVSNDAQRFLFIRPRASTGVKPPITVVVNWAANLPRK